MHSGVLLVRYAFLTELLKVAIAGKIACMIGCRPYASYPQRIDVFHNDLLESQIL